MYFNHINTVYFRLSVCLPVKCSLQILQLRIVLRTWIRRIVLKLLLIPVLCIG